LDVRIAARAASVRAARSQRLPRRVFPELVLPGTLIIAGTQARPTSQVPVTGELAHVHPQFGDEDFSGALGDAVDAIQPRQFLSERGDDLVDPFTQGRDGLIDIVRIPAIVNSESGRS
jgi:hypothetical protein